MKRVRNVISDVLVWLIATMAVCMMIFTVISITNFDRTDREFFGYKMLIVLSDSMSATDFNAGDLIFVKETDPAVLKEGDIIAYISRAQESYGETVAHKIRRLTTDASGNPGFITYGTTTDVDDDIVVTWQDVLGQYKAKIPGIGKFFGFIKTVPGYLLLILLPFSLLLVSQGISCVRLFREYRAEQLADINTEREKLKEEREANEKMRKELEKLKVQVESIRKEEESVPDQLSYEKGEYDDEIH